VLRRLLQQDDVRAVGHPVDIGDHVIGLGRPPPLDGSIRRQHEDPCWFVHMGAQQRAIDWRHRPIEAELGWIRQEGTGLGLAQRAHPALPIVGPGGLKVHRGVFGQWTDQLRERGACAHRGAGRVP